MSAPAAGERRSLPVSEAPAGRTVVNLDELCRALGKSEPTIRRWLDKWRDFPVQRRGSNGVAYEFVLEEARAFLEERHEEISAEAAEHDERLRQARLDFTGGTVADDKLAALTPAEQLRAAAAEQAMLKLRKERGELVDRRQVELVVAQSFERLRRALDRLADDVEKGAGLDQAAAALLREKIDEGRNALVDHMLDGFNLAEPESVAA